MSTIEVVEESVSKLNQHEVHDCLFNVPGDLSSIDGEDLTYNTPDYRFYLFSTMGKNICAINNSNILHTVREKNPLKNSVNLHNLQEVMSAEFDGDGIWIAEYYKVPLIIGINVEQYLSHYIDNMSIAYDDSVKEDIIQTLKDHYGRTMATKALGLTFRIITFIPKSEIVDKKCVYSKETNLVFTTLNNIGSIKHPNTINDPDMEYPETSNTSILFDVIDNKGNTPYYIKVGNNIHKLIPNKSPVKENGATITVRNKEFITDQINLNPSDYSDAGIYTSYNECLTNGDVRLLLEEKELDFKHLELDTGSKMLSEKQQHESAMQGMKLNGAMFDAERKSETHEMDMTAKKLNIVSDVYKHKASIQVLQQKAAESAQQHKQQMNKLEADNSGKTLGTLTGLVTKLI